MHASTLVLLVTSPLNALMTYVLVHRTRMTFLGAPLAMSITYYLSFFLLVAYARWGPPPPDSNDMNSQRRSSLTYGSARYHNFTSDADSQVSIDTPKVTSPPLTLRDVLAPAPMFAFLRLALPGILMVATEWWAFEIVALAAGKLGRLPLAAQAVIMTADQSGCRSC